MTTDVADGRGAHSVETKASNAFLQLLMENERVWLRDHPIIRVFQDPYWPPIEFIDERGESSGMTKDYLNIIEQRLV